MFSDEDLERKRLELRMSGVNITDWAKERQFSREMVYAVLHGRSKAYLGQAYEIAKALGLIPSVVQVQLTDGKIASVSRE